MEKLQEYLSISLMWYGKAENYRELAYQTTNPHIRYEELKRSELAALKGQQFEKKAQEELCHLNKYTDTNGKRS